MTLITIKYVFELFGISFHFFYIAIFERKGEKKTVKCGTPMKVEIEIYSP